VCLHVLNHVFVQCSSLIEYCSEFIHLNLDGVMNVGKKSVMNQYLNDMLADSLHRSGKRHRDDHHHPFITDVLTAGNNGRPTFDREWLSNMEEWIEGCNKLSNKPMVQKLLVTFNGREEECYSLGGRRRRASCCRSDYAASAVRNRSLSTVSDYESKDAATSSPQASEGVLDRCIKKTANMDISSTELAKENSVWLAKEIRGVRKKLNQITKLQDSEADATTFLSTEQRAKVDRRPILEAEFCIYENALEKVEARIKSLALEEQNEREAKNVARNSETSASEDGHEYDEGKKTPVEEKRKPKSSACEICGIKCPDETSFELHNNGRKHRNRVAQAAETEKAKAATAIMESQHLDQVKGSERVVQTPPIAKQTKKAWGVSSVQPKFALPPPPHPTVPPVPSPRYPWKANTQSRPQTPLVTPTKAAPAYGFTTVPKKDEKTGMSSMPKTSPISTGSPVWHSAPGSSRCVPLHVYSAKTLPPSPSARTGQSSSFSLADFLAPKPNPNAKSPGGKSWTSRQAKAAAAPKSLAQIQAEETDFIARQDKTYETGGGSTWFFERRERANSLREIQNSAVKEQEELEFIEEQKRIEEQIQKQLALQQKQHLMGQAGKKKRGPAKRTPGKSPKAKSGGENKSAGRDNANSNGNAINGATKTSGASSQNPKAKPGRPAKRNPKAKKSPAGQNQCKKRQENKH
jgi:hypothetical protein